MIKLNIDNAKKIDKIIISNITIADIKDYDCFICAGFTDDNNFLKELCEIFYIHNIFVFDKDKNVKNLLHDNVNFYNLEIGIKRTNKTANLSYFYGKYKNIFLKMNLFGIEFSWLYSVDMFYLLNFKQIIIYYYFDCEDISKQNICLEKIGYTHDIISISEYEKYIIVTYLRKKIYENDIDFKDMDNENKKYYIHDTDDDIVGITIDKVAELI